MPGYIFIREIKDRNMAGKKKKRGRKKIVLFVFEILLLGVLLGVLWLYNTTLGQVDFDDDALSASEAGINEDIDEDALEKLVYNGDFDINKLEKAKIDTTTQTLRIAKKKEDK